MGFWKGSIGYNRNFGRIDESITCMGFLKGTIEVKIEIMGFLSCVSEF